MERVVISGGVIYVTTNKAAYIFSLIAINQYTGNEGNAQCRKYFDI